MYSNAIRQMIEFVLHLSRSNVHTLTVHRNISFIAMNHQFVWDGSELKITTNSSTVSMKFGLVNSEDRNYISTNTQRLNIKFNHDDFYTYLSPELTVLTSEMMVDEGTYQQHMVFADLRDFDEVHGIYQVAHELVENNIRYFGTYRIPLIDMGYVARQLEWKYPETAGYWGRYLNV